MEGDEPKTAHSPFISDYIYKWLDNALDSGITEYEFWNMTIAELERAFQSKRRIQEAKEKEKAIYDYILADLIGRSIARMQSSANHMPEIGEAYPWLFDSEEVQEQKQAKKDELSALRFKLFAQSHNKKFLEVAKD